MSGSFQPLMEHPNRGNKSIGLAPEEAESVNRGGPSWISA